MNPQEASGSNPLPDHVHAMMAEDQAEILRLRAEVERLMGTREEWLEQAATNWAPARLLFVEGQLTTVVMDAARLVGERDSALAEVERLTAERAGWVARACNADARRCDGCSEPNRCGCEYGVAVSPKEG